MKLTSMQKMIIAIVAIVALAVLAVVLLIVPRFAELSALDVEGGKLGEPRHDQQDDREHREGDDRHDRDDHLLHRRELHLCSSAPVPTRFTVPAEPRSPRP